MTYRNDGDALLARNDALAAENERLRAENERLQALRLEGAKVPPAPAPPTTTALVAPPRAGDHALVAPKPVAKWKKWGAAAVLWIAAIGVAILQGIIPIR